MRRLILPLLFLFITSLSIQAQNRWSIERANNWYKEHDWLVGANFIPSTAINQLEMWQANTFDPKTIDKELGWASQIGFNTMRVYLHSLAYQADSVGFKKRIHHYLSIADKHHIKTIFVFFDDVWGKTPKIGKQPVPKPGVHNSGWMQDPGDPASKDTLKFPQLERYVKDILTTFKDDKRIILWDLYNEPSNTAKGNTSLPLLKNVFAWARTINPSQPLTVGLWHWRFEELNAFQALHSDIISYHNYNDEKHHKQVIETLKTHGRPLICTEYMARTRHSKFTNILPLLKKEKVAAINWGLVAGKTNTIFEWDKPIKNGKEPNVWFHDIFRPNGTPYNKEEIALIKKLTLDK